jgi:hypothetical protein
MNQIRFKMESPLNRSSSMTTSKVKFSMLSSSSGITSAQASKQPRMWVAGGGDFALLQQIGAKKTYPSVRFTRHT